MRTWVLTAVVLAPMMARGQDAPQRFEVASIKTRTADPEAASGIQTGRGRLEASNVTLKRCIMGAFNVGPQQISGGPAWLETDHFAISAKADSPAYGDAALMIMLQSLLAERFKLVVHRGTRSTSAFVLEVAKNGPKLVKAEPGAAGTNTSTGNTGVTIDAHNTDMDSFARILARKTDLPVVNRTGLPGRFDVKLQWTPESMKLKESAGMEGPSIFTALQEQLGLRLRAQKTTMEILVIDRAEKPTEN